MTYSHRYNKRAVFLVLILVALFLMPLASKTKYLSELNSDSCKYDENKIINFENLKTSGTEINITTPENKTYTSPMSGYYPAVYGFENDIPGSEPSGWEVQQPDGSGFIRIVSTLAGHNNILELRKNGGVDKGEIRKTFETNASKGTIEFWLYKDTNSGTDPTRFYIDDTTAASLQFGIMNGDLYRDPFDSRTTIAYDVFTINEWHRIRVNFDITQGWEIELDGIMYGSGYSYAFWADTPLNLTRFGMNSIFSGCNPNYAAYLDALGYSWDPNYNIGDYLNEGLLLSFENNTVFDWTGYSLDGQINRTIYSNGNTTIPMPHLGRHTIQVFGNSSVGTIYESDIRHFTIGGINIITPENKTYTDPMSGYYPATYGFENDHDGSAPQNWIVNIIGAGNPGSVQILEELGEHKKVMRLDGENSGINADWKTQAIINFDNIQTSGSIEFYGSASDNTKHTRIFITDGQTKTGVYVWFTRAETQQLSWRNYPQIDQDIIPISNNQWYHLKFTFDCDTDTCDVYVNNILGLAGANFYQNVDNLSTIIFETYDDGDVDFLVDAIGFSWDTNYNAGNNLNEGLLLSFENGTVLDWVGYSLDGQSNRTILGNTTIPMPENGFHYIQIFANDTFGTLYTSDIVYFTVAVESEAPIISDGGNGGKGGNGTETDFTPFLITLVIILSIALIATFVYVKHLNNRKKAVKDERHPPKSKKEKKPKVKKQKKKKKSRKIVEEGFISCPYCFNKTPSSAEYCSYCGTNLKDKKGESGEVQLSST